MRSPIKENQDYNALMKRLGRRLRESRVQNALTQKELAASMGPPYPGSNKWISDIERGINSVDVITMQRLADRLEYPIAYFSDPRYDSRRPQWPHGINEWLILSGGDEKRAFAHADLEHTQFDGPDPHYELRKN